MRQRSTGKTSGFVLTFEAVLILTILGIGLLVGIVAVRDALFRKAVSIQDQKFFVFDSTAPEPIAIGEVIGFDEHEAPWVPFIDYDVAVGGQTVNVRALIGVRDDRFTSRQPIFYTGAACTGTPCIAGPSEELPYNFGAGQTDPTTGAVGYLYALQGITYGIGAGIDTVSGGVLKGRLFRQTTADCPASAVSAWDSQRVVTGSPCIGIAAIAGGLLFTAESVVLPDGSGDNVLDDLIPPFWTNVVSTPPLLTPIAPPANEGGP